MKHVDVLIVGGSLAGAACVRELTRLGVDAVAFDRDRFPREKVCGGFLSPGAVDLLDQLELLDDVRAAGAKVVRSSRIRVRNLEVSVGLRRPGLGISRRTLDRLVAGHCGVQHGAVHNVRREGEGFRVRMEDEEISARVVIDAAGKLSRFSPRRTTSQFGVQFYESESRGDVLDFRFFEGGYGGSVSVEDSRSSTCILIYKDALPRYLGRTDCRVTGPLSYERGSSDFLSIGDAAGMVDPFCGEGMRHALDTGMRAAGVVAEGLRRGEGYDGMRARYERKSAQRWRGKRRLGKFLRGMLRYPRIFATGLWVNPEYWLGKMWE